MPEVASVVGIVMVPGKGSGGGFDDKDVGVVVSSAGYLLSGSLTT